MTLRERSRKPRRKWQRLVSEQGKSGHSVVAFYRSAEAAGTGPIP